MQRGTASAPPCALPAALSADRGSPARTAFLVSSGVPERPLLARRLGSQGRSPSTLKCLLVSLPTLGKSAGARLLGLQTEFARPHGDDSQKSLSTPPGLAPCSRDPARSREHPGRSSPQPCSPRSPDPGDTWVLCGLSATCLLFSPMACSFLTAHLPQFLLQLPFLFSPPKSPAIRPRPVEATV